MDTEKTKLPDGLVRIQKLRSGIPMICGKCGRGLLKPEGDCQSSHCFTCDVCGNKIMID